MSEEASRPWMIRDMPLDTRRLVKVFAAERNMTIADALDMLIRMGLDASRGKSKGVGSVHITITNPEAAQALMDVLIAAKQQDKIMTVGATGPGVERRMYDEDDEDASEDE